MSYRKEKTPILEPGPKTKCWGQAPKPGPETTAPEKMNKPLLVLFQKNNHQRSTYACKCLPVQDTKNPHTVPFNRIDVEIFTHQTSAFSHQ